MPHNPEKKIKLEDRNKEKKRKIGIVLASGSQVGEKRVACLPIMLKQGSINKKKKKR
jgi:hypothetical protein